MSDNCPNCYHFKCLLEKTTKMEELTTILNNHHSHVMEVHIMPKPKPLPRIGIQMNSLVLYGENGNIETVFPFAYKENMAKWCEVVRVYKVKMELVEAAREALHALPPARAREYERLRNALKEMDQTQ